MDRKELLQTALRVLQRINRQQPVAPEDEEALRQNAAASHAGLGLDQIAIEIIQRLVKK